MARDDEIDFTPLPPPVGFDPDMLRLLDLLRLEIISALCIPAEYFTLGVYTPTDRLRRSTHLLTPHQQSPDSKEKHLP